MNSALKLPYVLSLTEGVQPGLDGLLVEGRRWENCCDNDCFGGPIYETTFHGDSYRIAIQYSKEPGEGHVLLTEVLENSGLLSVIAVKPQPGFAHSYTEGFRVQLRSQIAFAYTG